jgi:DNA-binding PadR family transcriptional regulator
MASAKQSLTIELALLGLLRRQPMHPYELFQQLQRKDSLGLIWQVKQSHLYALLDRLEADGYLSHQLETQGSRPPRKVLSLTPAGEARFMAWLTTPVAHGRDIRLEFLAKFYFARLEGLSTVVQLLERQLACCRQWLADNEERIARLATDSFERLVLQYRAGQLQATIHWLEACWRETALQDEIEQN